MVEQFLKDKGAAIVDDLSIPHLSDSLGMWSTLMADSGAPHFAVLMGNVNPIYELLKWTIGRSHHTLPGNYQ